MRCLIGYRQEVELLNELIKEEMHNSNNVIEVAFGSKPIASMPFIFKESSIAFGSDVTLIAKEIKDASEAAKLKDVRQDVNLPLNYILLTKKWYNPEDDGVRG